MADELKIQWNIGNDCNYNCSYCHSDLKNGSNPFPNLDKLRVGFDNIVRQAQPFSLVKLELMGGEITQSPAIKDIMLMPTNPKIDFRIYSNGSADIAWWEEVRPNIYHMDLTYHPSSDLTHFVSVVKAINKIAGKGLNLIIAAPHDNWGRAIEAYKELKPLLPKLGKNKKKLVSIAIHSTSQCKYWNNPTGWQEVVDFLKDKGYEVRLLSREEDGYCLLYTSDAADE